MKGVTDTALSKSRRTDRQTDTHFLGFLIEMYELLNRENKISLIQVFYRSPFIFVVLPQFILMNLKVIKLQFPSGTICLEAIIS